MRKRDIEGCICITWGECTFVRHASFSSWNSVLLGPEDEFSPLDIRPHLTTSLAYLWKRSWASPSQSFTTRSTAKPSRPRLWARCTWRPRTGRSSPSRCVCVCVVCVVCVYLARLEMRLACGGPLTSRLTNTFSLAAKVRVCCPPGRDVSGRVQAPQPLSPPRPLRGRQGATARAEKAFRHGLEEHQGER